MRSSTDGDHAFLDRLMVGLLLFFVAAGFLVLVFKAPLPARLQVGDSSVVYYSNGLPAHVFLADDDRWRIAVAADEVDPAYVEALLRFEDKRFHEHHGVDVLAVVRAAWLNLSSGRRMSGASTITMQLVRMLEPRPRTYWSKAVEALRAFQIESRMSKAEILSAYLTYAPYGRNLEGIEAASFAYFGHSAAELAPSEIATLLAVPQNPNSRYPSPTNAARLRAARDEIAQWLLDEGALPLGPPDAQVAPDEVMRMVALTDPPSALRPFPREMPHVAYWLRGQRARRARFETTIDPGLQLVVERVVAAHRERAWRDGIDSAAVVVIDNDTGDVRALVGNFDFFAERPGAQIAAFALSLQQVVDPDHDDAERDRGLHQIARNRDHVQRGQRQLDRGRQGAADLGGQTFDIQLQAHDPETDVEFGSIRLGRLDRP